MDRKSKVVITSILAFVFFLIVIYNFLQYFFVAKGTNTTIETPINESNSSVFENIYQGSNNQVEEISNLKPERSPEEEIQMILANDTKYWNEWNWKKSLVEARILNVDIQNKEITLSITRPENKSFTGKTRRVLVECSPQRSALINASDPLKIVNDENVDLFAQAATSDILHAYCLDSNCFNLGRQCILTKVNK